MFLTAGELVKQEPVRFSEWKRNQAEWVASTATGATAGLTHPTAATPAAVLRDFILTCWECKWHFGAIGKKFLFRKPRGTWLCIAKWFRVAWRRRPLSEGEFLGALSGFDHRFDQSDPQFAFFELEDSIDGAAGGSGDGVFEQRRMVPGFKHNGGGAEGGLGGEQSGDVAGQADLHSRLGKRFENNVDVGRAAGRQAGDGVHVLFIDHDGATDNPEQGAGVFDILGAGV